MLWSFIKVAVFFILVAAITLGAMQLLESGEAIRITAMNTEFTLSPLMAVIGVLLIFVAVWLTIRIVGLIVALLRFLNGDETALSRYFDRNRERKGYQALSDAILATAAGDPKQATSSVKKAERLLQKPQVTQLVAAQAHEMAGDTKNATDSYKVLLTDDRTRFVGIRGLMRQKLAEGDTDTAMKLAEKAWRLKPGNVEVQDTLLKLSTEKGQWADARKVLKSKRATGELPKDLHKRRDAVLALQEAKVVLDEGASIEAQEAAIAANKSSPDLIPAAAMAARTYIAKEKPKAAIRVIKKAWEAQPHPDLATVFAEIEPTEDAQARLKRFQKLLVLRPDHEETRLLKAELNIAAENFPEARRAIGDLAQTHPTARVMAILAAIERGEGADDAVVRGWLARALSAPRGPQWCCDKCQTIQPEWMPICDNCGGFDTLTWREPTKTEQPLPHGAEMLPVIVGQPAVTPVSQDISEPAPNASKAPAAAPEDAEIVDPVGAATVAPTIVTDTETEGAKPKVV
ncbi:heme biosynthesis protein HemY [Thioclava sp. SK-1]|uniref:heme biosynthesis protein HemY n=1 Tax=Thioclava sp. SK-1 TaxID=1889770 RepID=UPI000825C317|nr:heme biosynthesis HemY N-terminal domain-containing protein [Thioclava sp. SK-1]OCX61609.1 heme biosynthesis protein HemY [Thioclava sp. SK-1]